MKDTKQLVMEKEKNILLGLLNNETIKDEISSILKNDQLIDPKSAEDSTEARKKGNILLQQEKHQAGIHKEIFSHFCESIAFAPVQSKDLAFAYANRADFLLHIRNYEDCIKDIDQALNITIFDALKVKLLCRKAKCLKELGFSSDVTSILETAKDLVDKVDSQDKIKLLNTIDELKTLLVSSSTKVKTNNTENGRFNRNELPVTDDYTSRVTIEYCEKYGRHLVAAKDYKPGDVIFVEKLYASAFEQGSSLTACDYCLKAVWSSIPCDHCNWSMYCSESCKEKALNNYHDIECPLISYLKEYSNVDWKPLALPIRVLITGIKETGSIANLKRELELMDESTDGSSLSLFNSGQLGVNNIKNIYSLSSHEPSDSLVSMSAIPSILMSLTKCSKLKNDFKVEKIEDLATNEDIMFLGSLLIKLMQVIDCNAVPLQHNQYIYKRKKYEIVHPDDKRCLSVLNSFLNHSCFPTADWQCTENNTFFIYALKPIRKNSQIFINYGYLYENDKKSSRQEDLLKYYNFTCDCQACDGAWPILQTNNGLIKAVQVEDDDNDFGEKQTTCDTLQKIIRDIEKGQTDESHIKTVSSLITQGSYWKKPSFTFIVLIHTLETIFTAIYSPKSLPFSECHKLIDKKNFQK